MTPDRVASLIDHTLLRPDATRADIEALCREAVAFGFATVCVNPAWVTVAAACLTGTRVGVCTVVGFPLGASTMEAKAFEARQAVVNGATEIDMVLNIGALKSGDMVAVERDISGVVTACRDGRAASKVIIEACFLTDDEKRAASAVAKACGADFVKTSTGFGPGGATPADVALIRSVVGSSVGVKAAGGIRELSALEAMVGAGATRIGTSAGVRLVEQARSST